MKKIFLFGSTGSIGLNTISVMKEQKKDQLVGISFNSKINVAIQQINEIDTIKFICCPQEFHSVIQKRFPKLLIYGKFSDVFKSRDKFNFIVNAVSGFIGLDIFMGAIKHKIDIAFANKEPFVAAGEIITKMAAKAKIDLIPMDSEHNAIWQALKGEKREDIKEIILTASGGPFYNYTLAQLNEVTIEDALNHPTWNMGSKISIGSATLFNKTLEMIEAFWLFNTADITVAINKSSLIHSLVKFRDNTIKAIISKPDMRLPIQLALNYPNRTDAIIEDMDLYNIPLILEKPDINSRFRALHIGHLCIEKKGTLPAVFNAANEEVTELFLTNKIKFIDISYIVENIINQHNIKEKPSLEEIIKADKWARDAVKQFISRQEG